MIKLLNSSSELILFNKGEKIILNSEKLFIIIENFEKIEINGNDCLVYFFIPLTGNNYLISDSNVKDIDGVKEIFILPEKTNYDIINLILTINESKNDEIVLFYYIDCNIIPYSRNKNDLITKIVLKRNKKEYILINNFFKNNKATYLNDEKFYIFLCFEDSVNINYELKYSNYQILKENEQIMISPGNNKIYIGYQNNNFLKFDKCGEQNISLDIYKNEEINQSNIIISENDLISCSKNDKDGYLSLEINSQENFLLSLSHDNISMFNNIIQNYNFELSLDEIKKNVIITYSPISNFPHVEYYVFITDKIYYSNLTNHCFINNYLNDIYIQKFMFLSNGEEEIFNKTLIIDSNQIECNETYSFLIVAKEIINDYPNYHYYNPKNFFIDESVCNSHFLENYFNYYILGIDMFFFDDENKKVIFNFFFAANNEIPFLENIILYLKINYTNKLRYLEDNGEIIKSKCKLKDNEIKNQKKYECQFNIKEESISNVESLDTIELNSQKIELQNISFLHLLYKNNIQNAKNKLFNKILYFLEDSIVTNDQNEFNITGNFKGDIFNYTKLILQFHSNKTNNEIHTSNCNVINLNESKYILSCSLDNLITTEIIDGYSNFEDRHLFVLFHNEKNIIEMKNNNQKNKRISTWVILVIVLSIFALISLGIIVIIILYRKKLKNKNNAIPKNPAFSEKYGTLN